MNSTLVTTIRFGLQEKVAEILITAAAVDQHANISIESFYHPEANLGPTVVQDAVQMFQQRFSQFLKRDQPLPLQLIHPFRQIVEHGSFVAVVPQPLQTFFEQVGLEN